MKFEDAIMQLKHASKNPGTLPSITCMKAILKEIERLRAIVDKLPKCWRLNEAGKLVQDEPILSGMNAVTICKTNTEEVGVISVEAYAGGEFDIVIRDGDGNEWYLNEEELYLTKAAAEAAKEV